jgi:hypothetical protein
LVFRTKKRNALAVFATVLAAMVLAACSTESAPATAVPTQAAEATAAPTPTPAPTAIPHEDFAVAEIPPADPERLAQLTKVLSLVPEDFSSAIYLDTAFLVSRSNESLVALINPDVLGLDLALPSIATGLVSALAVAVDFQTRNVVTPFQSNFAIANMLQLAGGFGLQLGGDGPTTYEGHDVWSINALGKVLAMASADATTGVATSGQRITPEEATALAEASLDGFDGRSPSILDAPGISSLLADVPSGFAAGVLSQCETLPLFNGVQGLTGCTGVVVSADTLPGDLVVFHALIGFSGPDAALSAMQQAADALENENQSQGFEDLGVRQEDGNIRVRVIVDVSKFAEVFRLFSPEG